MAQWAAKHILDNGGRNDFVVILVQSRIIAWLPMDVVRDAFWVRWTRYGGARLVHCGLACEYQKCLLIFGVYLSYVSTPMLLTMASAVAPCLVGSSQTFVLAIPRVHAMADDRHRGALPWMGSRRTFPEGITTADCEYYLHLP